MGADLKTITRAELSRFNGKNGAPSYVAIKGKIYDLSASFVWKQGKHQVLHQAGADLTQDLEQAPHGEDMLERYSVIGMLAD